VLAKRVVGTVVLAYAVFVAVQLSMNIDSLKQTSEAFAEPEDPFWYFWGFIALNSFMVLAAGVLGAYFLRARKLKLKYVLPLSIVSALYGGYSILIGVIALSVCIYQRYRPVAI